jgi:hypothetical protein
VTERPSAPSPVTKSRSVIRLLCAQQAKCLAKFDRHRFGIITGRALEGPPVVIDLIGWLDTREKHWHSAQRASTMALRRPSQVEMIRLRHDQLTTMQQ